MLCRLSLCTHGHVQGDFFEEVYHRLLRTVSSVDMECRQLMNPDAQNRRAQLVVPCLDEQVHRFDRVQQLSRARAGQYWRPNKQNQAVFDGFCYISSGRRRIAVGFQMTINERHGFTDANTGAVECVRKLLQMFDELYLVFIVPKTLFRKYKWQTLPDEFTDSVKQFVLKVSPARQ